MENVGIFIAILECLRAIWCILWPFGIFMAIWYFYGHLVFLWPFGIFMAIWYFYGHLEYFTVILYILWPFGIFCGHLVLLHWRKLGSCRIGTRSGVFLGRSFENTQEDKLMGLRF
jgi:hypothetical protein